MDDWAARHRQQLDRSPLPAAALPAVYELVSAQSFTAGGHIVLSAIAGGGTDTDTGGLAAVAKAPLPVGLCFLVDHAWPFTSLDDALGTLEQMPALLRRVCDVVGLATDEDDFEGGADAVSPLAAITHLAPLLGSYRVATPPASAGDPPGQLEVFYMMDEVGCRIREAPTEAQANCVLASLTDATTGEGYCVVCVTRPVAEEELLLRWTSDPTHREHQRGIPGRLLGAALPAGAAGEAPQPSASSAAAEAEGEGVLPVVRFGVCESQDTNTHSSLMYKPFLKTQRKLAALGAGRYTAEYVHLCAADFPKGAADDAEALAAAGKHSPAPCPDFAVLAPTLDSCGLISYIVCSQGQPLRRSVMWCSDSLSESSSHGTVRLACPRRHGTGRAAGVLTTCWRSTARPRLLASLPFHRSRFSASALPRWRT